MKFKSVFDIIGPVMIGPSSSHTAGAVRIGQIARNIFAEKFIRADIHFYGSFAQTYKGHATDVALIGGLLGFNTDDARIIHAKELAQQQNISINFIIETAQTQHPNTVKIELYGDEATSNPFSLIGVSIGGGSVNIIEINGFSLNLNGENPALLIFHQDTFGTIASVTKLLALHSINISHMEVSRTEKGQTALMVIESDEPINSNIINQLNQQEHIIKIITLEV